MHSRGQPAGAGDRTQVIKLSSECFYLPSHLPALMSIFESSLSSREEELWGHRRLGRGRLLAKEDNLEGRGAQEMAQHLLLLQRPWVQLTAPDGGSQPPTETLIPGDLKPSPDLHGHCTHGLLYMQKKTLIHIKLKQNKTKRNIRALMSRCQRHLKEKIFL